MRFSFFLASVNEDIKDKFKSCETVRQPGFYFQQLEYFQ